VLFGVLLPNVLVEVVLWQLVMMFEEFGTTFVYVVVRRFVFDFGVSFVFGVSFY